MKTVHRVLLVAVILFTVYQVVQLKDMRGLYYRWDKLAHGLAFAWVYMALAWALRWRGLWLALLAAALGGAVELHQFFLPGFEPSWGDWAADLAGVALAWLTLTVWARQMGPRPPQSGVSSRPGATQDS